MAQKWSSHMGHISHAENLSPTSIHEPMENNMSTNTIPIRIKLGENVMSFIHDKWVLETSNEEALKLELQAIKSENEKLLKENMELKESKQSIVEESNLIRFKNQLLVEMLAVTGLDEEKHRMEYQKEKFKSQSLKEELRSLLKKTLEAGITYDSPNMKALIEAPNTV